MIWIQLLIGLLTFGDQITVGVPYIGMLPFVQNVTHSSGTIAGRVLDAGWQPVSGAQVLVERSDIPMGKLPFVYTDEQGKFLIKDLATGTYMVYVAKEEDGYPPTYSAFHFVGPVDIPRITIDAQHVTPEVIIQMGPKAARVIGRIVDAITKKPIENAQIILRRIDNTDYSYLTGPNQLEEKGAFKILVPSVPFTIKVSAPGYEDWYYGGNDSKEKAGALKLAPNTTKELLISLRPVK